MVIGIEKGITEAIGMAMTRVVVTVIIVTGTTGLAETTDTVKEMVTTRNEISVAMIDILILETETEETMMTDHDMIAMHRGKTMVVIVASVEASKAAEGVEALIPVMVVAASEEVEVDSETDLKVEVAMTDQVKL